MPQAALNLEFVTPCFLGGSDNRNLAEWRAPSVRGQLRWWYRALAGGQKAGRLADVRAGETALFGSTERASPIRVRTSGQPTVVPAGQHCSYGAEVREAALAREWLGPHQVDEGLKRQVEDRLRVRRKDGRPASSNPLTYLGYGCVDYRGQARAHIAAGSRARLDLSWPGRLGASPRPDNDLDVFKAALWAWLNLGGIGARSRRGFGSLCCRTLEGDLGAAADFAPTSVERFKEQARERLAGLCLHQPLPEWSHLSSGTRILIATAGSHAEQSAAGARTPRSRPGWDVAMQRAGGWLIGLRRRYGKATDERQPLPGLDYEWAAPNGHERFKGIPDRAGFACRCRSTRRQS